MQCGSTTCPASASEMSSCIRPSATPSPSTRVCGDSASRSTRVSTTIRAGPEPRRLINGRWTRFSSTPRTTLSLAHCRSGMQWLKSMQQRQRFLLDHTFIYGHLRLRRHRTTAEKYAMRRLRVRAARDGASVAMSEVLCFCSCNFRLSRWEPACPHCLDAQGRVAAAMTG
jgi:hypothetical protein